MHEPKVDTLEVPGATLHHEVRGSGPVLLLVCGGIYDAHGFERLAAHLADRHTVVTYDRRGNSRSPLDAAPEPQRIEVHADDARRLLEAVGVTADGPADVFGNSSGAIIGLELAVQHPELVRTVVAHEPPMFDLLPDREHWRRVMASVEQAFHDGGAWPAMAALNAGFGGDDAAPAGQETEPGEVDEATAAHLADMEAAMAQNVEAFVGYEVPSFSRHVVELDALRASSARVVAAVGAASEGEPPHRAGLAVAEALGSEAVVLPGDHGGFDVQHEAFAAGLEVVLDRG